ncbi:MAG: hypothetical protein IGS03_02165 [Candidatus Sericytochromatia bacterium]|nr:hypothetical protein [Candidatus Sericytochromatia bacterium]
MRYLLLKVCLLLSPVLSLQTEASAVSGPPLPATERHQIETALQALERVQQQWPRQTPLPPCIVLFGAQAQWLLGCRSVPTEVTPVIGQIFAGEPVYVSTEPLILHHVRVPYAQISTAVVGQGLLYMPEVPASAPYREQPWFLIQRQGDLQRQHPAFQDITATEWLSLFVHEIFHMLMQLPEPGIAAQLARAGQPAGGFVDQEALKAFYRQEPELQALLAAEHRLLLRHWHAPGLCDGRDRPPLARHGVQHPRLAGGRGPKNASPAVSKLFRRVSDTLKTGAKNQKRRGY